MAVAVALLLLLVLTAPVFASTPEVNINLRINASWGGGDMLNLDITDLDTGERQQVAIRLSDFIHDGENVQYILLQARDLPGQRQSGVIQIENPLFDPTRVPTGATAGNSGASIGVGDLPGNLQDIVAEANKPEPPTLTPNGTGTVVDNIMTINDIEFFTVTTDSGSEFFLVIDRQRQSDNIYLLNTVTEADLMALAEARGETLPTGTPPVPDAQWPEPPSAPTMEEILQAIQEFEEQKQQSQTPVPPAQNSNSGIIFLAVIILLLIGGIFLVWKVLLPKLQGIGQGSHEEIEEDENDYENEQDDGDDESPVNYESVETDEDEGFDHESGYGGDDSFHEGFGGSRGGADDEE